MKNKFRLSFVSKLMIMVMGSLFLVGVLSAVQYGIATNKIKESLRKDLLKTANGLSRSISSVFFERYGDIGVLAHNSVFQSRDVAAIKDVLNYTVGTYRVYDLILVLSPSGRFVAANDKSAEGKILKTDLLANLDFSKAPWFKAALHGEYTTDAAKGFFGSYVGGPTFEGFIEKVYGEPRYNNAFSTVVKNEAGVVRYVLVNFANFKWLGHEVLDVYSELEKSNVQGAEVAIIDHNGTIVFEHDPTTFSNGKNDLFFNPEILNRFNLLEKKYSGCEKLSCG